MVFYKYVGGIDSALRILGDLRLKVSPPNQFNDPFEMTPRSKFTMTDVKMVEKLKSDPSYSKALFELAQADGYDDTFERFMSVVPSMIPPKFPQYRRLARQTLIEGDMGSLNEASQYLALLCLSKTPDSIPMWAYYGDHHKSVVIGIDGANIGGSLPGPFSKVRYCKHRRPVDRWLPPSTPKWFNQISKTILTKSEVWKHEQEYRRVFRLQDTIGPVTGKKGDAMYFVNIDGKDIREIIFGCSISRNDEERIRAELKERPKIFRHITLLRCQRHPSRFELTIVPAGADL